MEGCPICGGYTSYMCSSCQLFLWKKQKIELKDIISGEDILEEITTQLSSECISQVIRNLTRKIKIADKFASEIIKNTQELLIKIEGMCMNAIKTVKAKKQYYMNLLAISQKQLISKERETIEIELQTSLKKSFPTLESKDIDLFYQFNFFKEYKNITQINLLEIDQAKYRLEKETGIFLEAHTSTVKCLLVTYENKYLISGDKAGKIIIWNLEESKQEAALRGHTAAVTILVVSRDNRHLVSGSVDKTIRIWSLQDKCLELALHGHQSNVSSLAITNDNNFIFSCSQNEPMKVWNLQDNAKETKLEGHEWPVRVLAITSDDKYIISCVQRDGTIRIWNLHERKQEAILESLSHVTAVAITSDDKFVVSGDKSGDITLWSFREKIARGSIKGHKGIISSLKITHDNKFVISSGKDDTFRIWDIKNRKQEFFTERHPLKALEMVNDKGYVIYGGLHGILTTYNFRGTRDDTDFPGHKRSVISLAKTNNNKYIFSACYYEIMTWSVKKKRVIGVLSHFNVATLAKTADDKYIVSASMQGTIYVWRIKTAIRKQ